MGLTYESQKELDVSEEIKNLKKVEASLFISARYVSIQELVGYTDINPLLLRELLEKLRKQYKDRDSAIEIIENNGVWKMDVKEEYHKMINKMATGEAEFTKAEQETLAVIAYKQPVKQSVIIKIRGNKAYDHIKHFIDVGLLKAKKIGHTKELNLSENFYDYFNLEQKGDKNKVIVKDEIEKESVAGDSEDLNNDVVEDSNPEVATSKQLYKQDENLIEDVEDVEDVEKKENISEEVIEGV